MKESELLENDESFLWHTKGIDEVAKILETSIKGLSTEQAKKKIKDYGENKLPSSKPDSFIIIFLRQFQNPLIYILFIAGFIVLFLNETVDAIIIFSVLFLNAIIGSIKEGKAQNALLALSNFTKTESGVLRDGKEIVVEDSQIVPGDILILREGDKVSADGRVIEENNLKVDESALTGESNPVTKTKDILKEKKLQTADRINMVFKGTLISSGSGKVLITDTGLNTVIGKISKQLIGIDTEVPLKKNIRRLSRTIAVAILIISSFVFFFGVLMGHSADEMFFTSVAIMVSLIPVGLPIVITLILATGVYRMAKQNALVKRLQAVDALGQAKIIAVDKTGTITRNELMVSSIFINGKSFEVKGQGYEPEGEISLDGRVINPIKYPELLLAEKISIFNSSAQVSFLEDENVWKVSGDPTEAAIDIFAKKVNSGEISKEVKNKKIFELPFNSKNKYYATIHKINNHNFLSVTGAPEIVLTYCQKIYSNGEEKEITDKEKSELGEIIKGLSSKGLRVVALSYVDKSPSSVSENDIPPLVFVGFYAMSDVIRDGVKDSIMEAKANGINVIMITGDHSITANYIAEKAGIWKEGDEILSGNEIDDLDDNTLSSRLDKITVFARVTPEHKLRIIDLYKKRGDIIAMTGDGVNDALSLVAADLGVAMGKIGTEVTKEASDIILLDDNFKSIVSAIEEGRNIYKTIKKVILYLFSTGVGELFTIFSALFVLATLPILPGQIIWLNLVTDGILVVALAMDPREKLSGKALKKSDRSLFDKTMFGRMIIMSGTMAIGAFYLFNYYYIETNDFILASTVCLIVLAMFQWFNIWNCRSDTKSIFTIDFFSNKYLILSTLVVFGLQIFAVYTPFMQNILNTASIGVKDWLIIIAVASSIILVEEIRKLLVRIFNLR